MADVALVTTAIAGLVVSVGALLVSVGVLYLVMRIGKRHRQSHLWFLVSRRIPDSHTGTQLSVPV